MLTNKKIFGLLVVFIALLFGMYTISPGQQLADAEQNMTKASLNGVVVDTETDKPVSGAEVTIPLANKDDQTGKQGKFTLEGLNDGTHKLQVNHKNYKSYSKSVKVADGNNKLTIKLEPSS